RRRHTRFSRDWSSDVCSSDLPAGHAAPAAGFVAPGRGGKRSVPSGKSRSPIWRPISKPDQSLWECAGDRGRRASRGRVQDGAGSEFWQDMARAFGGALIFAFPLLMTMEMWWLGLYLARYKLALFVI